jgi:hypothetical protein
MENWEMHTLVNTIWASYIEKHGKRETHSIEQGIWGICIEKYRKWETYSIEHWILFRYNEKLENEINTL